MSASSVTVVCGAIHARSASRSCMSQAELIALKVLCSACETQASLNQDSHISLSPRYGFATTVARGESLSLRYTLQTGLGTHLHNDSQLRIHRIVRHVVRKPLACDIGSRVVPAARVRPLLTLLPTSDKPRLSQLLSSLTASSHLENCATQQAGEGACECLAKIGYFSTHRDVDAHGAATPTVAWDEQKTVRMGCSVSPSRRLFLPAPRSAITLSTSA